MRAWVIALSIGLVIPESVPAGLYNPAEPGEGKLNPDFKIFRNTLFTLRLIRADKAPDDPLLMRYMMMQQSAPRVIPADWTLAQRISLSAYLIRREKYQEAIELLKPLSRKERDNFLVQSNLSTAYHLLGQEPRQAYDYLDQALSSWPTKWDGIDKTMKDLLEQAGWDQTKFRNFREAETYQLKLLKLRLLEKAKPAGKDETPDDLFGVKFVGDSGSYEAGKLAEKEKAKLPARALAIVQQLLVWAPHDPRLYWLLGEVYNARGEVATALQIFEELAGFNGTYRPPMLANHLNVLRAAPKQQETDVNQETGSKPPAPADVTTRPAFDTRTFLVGIVVGIAVSIFAYWQLREVRRRRQSTRT